MLEQILELLKRIAAALGVSVEPPPTSPPPPPVVPPPPPVVPPPPTVPPSVPPTSPPPPPASGLTPVLPLPSGMVQSKRPGGQPWGVPWSNVARWAPLFEQAGREFGVAPLLLAAFSLVESDANHYVNGGTTGGDVIWAGPPDRPSIGIMQVVCSYHAASLPDADCHSPEGNIRLAAKLLASWIRSEGSWEAALTNKYHPGTDPSSGVSPTTYIRAVRDLIAEAKAGREPVTSPPPIVPPTSPPPSTGALTYGRVPKPAWTDRQIPDAQNAAWNNLGQRSIKGVVYHRQLGSNWGTDAYFRNVPPGGAAACPPGGDPNFVWGGCNGLTDFGIDATGGETLQWNDHRGAGRTGISPNRSPHASGPWGNPPGDGRCLVSQYGTNAINRDLVSLEVDGFYDDPIDAAGMEKLVAMTAYLADQAKVPWTNFPQNPHTGCVFTFWHSEFTTQKECPGNVVKQATPEIIRRAKERLKQYQEGAP